MIWNMSMKSTRQSSPPLPYAHRDLLQRLHRTKSQLIDRRQRHIQLILIAKLHLELRKQDRDGSHPQRGNEAMARIVIDCSKPRDKIPQTTKLEHLLRRPSPALAVGGQEPLRPELIKRLAETLGLRFLPGICVERQIV